MEADGDAVEFGWLTQGTVFKARCLRTSEGEMLELRCVECGAKNLFATLGELEEALKQPEALHRGDL